MKKIFSFCLTLVLLAGLLTGCGTASDTSAPNTQTKSLHIVTTIFPTYDWVRTVLGDQADNAEITFLLDNGVDMHSYQPSAEDIMKISSCDVFVYAGGESDAWASDALKNASNKNMQVTICWMFSANMLRKKKLSKGCRVPMTMTTSTEAENRLKKNRNMMNMSGYPSKMRSCLFPPLPTAFLRQIPPMQMHMLPMQLLTTNNCHSWTPPINPR